MIDPATPTSSTRRCGTTGAGPGASARAARAPASTSTYDGGETWKRLHRGRRPAQGGPRADRHRRLALESGRRLRPGRGQEERADPLRATAAATWKTVNAEQRRSTAPVLLRRPRGRSAVAEPPLQPHCPPPGLGGQRRSFETSRPARRGPRRLSRHVDRSPRSRPHGDRQRRRRGDQPRPRARPGGS